MQAIQQLADKAAIDSTLSFRSVVERQDGNYASTGMVSINSTKDRQSEQRADFAMSGFAPGWVQEVTTQ